MTPAMTLVETCTSRHGIEYSVVRERGTASLYMPVVQSWVLYAQFVRMKRAMEALTDAEIAGEGPDAG